MTRLISNSFAVRCVPCIWGGYNKQYPSLLSGRAAGWIFVVVVPTIRSNEPSTWRVTIYILYQLITWSFVKQVKQS